MSLTFLNEFRIHFEHFIVDDLREYGTPLHCSFLITIARHYTNTSCPPYASTPLLPPRPVCAVNNESLRLSNLGGQSILEPKQTKQSSRQLNLLHQNTLFLDWLHLAGSRMFYILGWIVECPIKLKSISYNENTFLFYDFFSTLIFLDK